MFPAWWPVLGLFDADFTKGKVVEGSHPWGSIVIERLLNVTRGWRPGPLVKWQSLAQSLPLWRLADQRLQLVEEQHPPQPVFPRCRGTGIPGRSTSPLAASRRMRDPRPLMNPLSKPPLWTRTVRVEYILLTPTWYLGTVASHYQKSTAHWSGRLFWRCQSATISFYGWRLPSRYGCVSPV